MLAWLTLESSSLFFDSFLFGLFFFFLGTLRIFFAELPHCVNHSVRTEFTLPSTVQCMQNKTDAGPLGAPQHSSSNLDRRLRPFWLTQGGQEESILVKLGAAGGAGFGQFWAAESASFGPGTTDFRRFWPFLGRQDARFGSNLDR